MRILWYTKDKDGSIWSFGSEPYIIEDRFNDSWGSDWEDYEQVLNWNTEFSKPNLFPEPQWGDKPLCIDLDTEQEMVIISKQDFNKLAGVDND